MRQDYKELLHKDLCARLHYGVKVTTTNPAVELGVISGISIEYKISVRTKHADIVFDCTEVKPYLRLMSEMTEEEKETYLLFSYARCNDKAFDWLNAHHFDYRGLIGKGLALKAPEGMYKIEK